MAQRFRQSSNGAAEAGQAQPRGLYNQRCLQFGRNGIGSGRDLHLSGPLNRQRASLQARPRHRPNGLNRRSWLSRYLAAIGIAGAIGTAESPASGVHELPVAGACDATYLFCPVILRKRLLIGFLGCWYWRQVLRCGLRLSCGFD